jgi:hypothetical protein
MTALDRHAADYLRLRRALGYKLATGWASTRKRRGSLRPRPSWRRLARTSSAAQTAGFMPPAHSRHARPDHGTRQVLEPPHILLQACDRARSPLERVPERSTRGDPELRDDLVEVRADRSVSQEQALADLLVAQARRCESCDLELLRRRRFGASDLRASDGDAGGTQLVRCPLRPRVRTQALERVE